MKNNTPLHTCQSVISTVKYHPLVVLLGSTLSLTEWTVSDPVPVPPTDNTCVCRGEREIKHPQAITRICSCNVRSSSSAAEEQEHQHHRSMLLLLCCPQTKQTDTLNAAPHPPHPHPLLGCQRAEEPRIPAITNPGNYLWIAPVKILLQKLNLSRLLNTSSASTAGYSWSQDISQRVSQSSIWRGPGPPAVIIILVVIEDGNLQANGNIMIWFNTSCSSSCRVPCVGDGDPWL